MKFAAFAVATIALSAIGLALDGITPPIAQAARSLELGQQIGKFCTIEFRDEARDKAHIMGTLTKVTPSWVVMAGAKRIDVSPDLQNEQELWVPTSSVTSVSF
ncbi:hypothetical protein EON80_10225 [bacterium]|nr:MAG: hypothetical protein EON80_10225 [bacterium]